MEERSANNKGLFALFPFLVFLTTYLVTSLILNDFYKMPIVVAVLLASIVAIFMNRKENIDTKIEIFTKGAGNSTIMLMCIIFILAGAFSSVAKETGAVDSTVHLALSILPERLLIPGIFLIGCFISLAIGTSTGTIAALSPIAIGISASTSFPVALILGAVLSGAMFGDGLSFISDTTIAATKSQGCKMNDKFKMNFKIILPAAIATFVIFYFMSGPHLNSSFSGNHEYSLLKVIPYLIVIIIALFGVNVFIVLIIGILTSAIIGLTSGSFDIWRLCHIVQGGIHSMTDIILISILLAGTVEIIKYNGGIDKMISLMKSKIHGQKGAQFGIGLLVFLVNLCTANNTIAIIMTGPLAKNIADKYSIEPKRTASLLDIFSCLCQGIIPYGAQILLAVSFVGMDKLSPLSIMRYAYYPYLAGICVTLAIILNIPKVKNPLV